MRKIIVDELEQKEKIIRGNRIKAIREKELKMSKSQFAKEIGISGQFLGLVEEGKGNLVYSSIRKLRDLSGHSSDYILFGLDDSVIQKTKDLIANYTEEEICAALEIIKNLSIFIKK